MRRSSVLLFSLAFCTDRALPLRERAGGRVLRRSGERLAGRRRQRPGALADARAARRGRRLRRRQIKAGDTVWLLSGYHGAPELKGGDFAPPITIAAAPGQTPTASVGHLQRRQGLDLARHSRSAPRTAPTPTVGEHRPHRQGERARHRRGQPALQRRPTAPRGARPSGSTWRAAACSSAAPTAYARNNAVTNVRFGISVEGKDALVEDNSVVNFSADGLRGLGDDGVFQYNLVKNVYVSQARRRRQPRRRLPELVGRRGRRGHGRGQGRRAPRQRLHQPRGSQSEAPPTPCRGSAASTASSTAGSSRTTWSSPTTGTASASTGMRNLAHRQQHGDRRQRRQPGAAVDQGHRPQGRHAERERRRAQQPRHGLPARRHQRHRRSQHHAHGSGDLLRQSREASISTSCPARPRSTPAAPIWRPRSIVEGIARPQGSGVDLGAYEWHEPGVGPGGSGGSGGSGGVDTGGASTAGSGGSGGSGGGAGPSASAGCGCRVKGDSAPHPLWMLAGLSLGLLRRRRRYGQGKPT